jgi:hypothetical protein
MSNARAAGDFTAAKLAVTEAGAATVSIPIQVPRGVGGMEPQLALDYSSGSRNGLIGLGWTLSGVSAITRCPKTPYHDGERGAVTFSSSDRFCLDGQRLVVVNDTNTDDKYGAANAEYRTFPDAFSRITAVGNYGGQAGVPGSFKVETKSGLIYEYGLSANSRVLTNFLPGLALGATVNRWMLQRISDRPGSDGKSNSVEFVYCAGSISSDGATCTTTGWQGSTLLHYIRYSDRGTTPGKSAVLFGYELRPDYQLLYTGGSKSVQSYRMRYIDTHVDFNGIAVADRGQRVRRYQLSYQATTDADGKSIRTTPTSRLVSVQELDGALTSKLPAVELAYSSDAVLGQYVDNGSGTPVPPDPPCGGVTYDRPKLMCP